MRRMIGAPAIPRADRMEAAMRTMPLLLSLLLTSAAMPALAVDGGLNVPAEAKVWPRWQSRLAIGTAPVGGLGDTALGEAGASRIASASVVGDWYFAPPVDGGFRATGGLVYGGRSLWVARPSLGPSDRNLTVDRRALPVADGFETSTVPYLGIGYTGLAGAGRFGFSADLGLLARSPSQAVRLGRMLGGTQNLDDAVRDLRLAPVLQLGVSYAF
jgi:hypothetical protein